jgi:site-specific recombinase XerD
VRPSVLVPVIAGKETLAVLRDRESFLGSIAAMFERWVARRASRNTQAAYRRDVLHFAVDHLGLRWPEEAHKLLSVGVADVQAFRDDMRRAGMAPKTINRRVCSIASFYKFLREAAAEAHLPIVIPNPAHAHFISRERSDPVEETESLSLNMARKLLALPEGESVLAARDRAILGFYLYTGARISTGCEREHDNCLTRDHDN